MPNIALMDKNRDHTLFDYNLLSLQTENLDSKIKNVPDLFTDESQEVKLVNLHDWFRVMVFEQRDLENKTVKNYIDYHLWMKDGRTEEKRDLFPEYDEKKWEEVGQGLKEFQTLKEDWFERYTDITVD
jgi:hypothetical protein